MNLYNDLTHFKLIGAYKDFKKIYPVLPDLIENCKVFTCFGPSLK